MARIGVFVCWCGENIARTVDVQAVAAEAAELPGVRLRGDLQVHVLRPGPGADPRKDRRRAAGRRRGRLLLAAHAPEDLPQGGPSGRAQSLPGGDGQHPRALLLGPPRPRRRPRPRPST